LKKKERKKNTHTRSCRRNARDDKCVMTEERGSLFFYFNHKKNEEEQ